MEPSASAFLGVSISVYRDCGSKDWYCLVSFLYLSFLCSYVHWGFAPLCWEQPYWVRKRPSRLPKPQLPRGSVQPEETQFSWEFCLSHLSFLRSFRHSYFWMLSVCPQRSCRVLFLPVPAHAFQRVWEFGQEAGVCSLKETCGDPGLLLI